jgi:hypothetical protein
MVFPARFMPGVKRQSKRAGGVGYASPVLPFDPSPARAPISQGSAELGLCATARKFGVYFSEAVEGSTPLFATDLFIFQRIPTKALGTEIAN